MEDEFAIEDAWSKYKELQIPMEDFRRETKSSMETQFSRTGAFLPTTRTERAEGPGELSIGGLNASTLLFDDKKIEKVEQAPQIDMPQRVGHPSHVNAPPREAITNRDRKILEVFGSYSVADNKKSDDAAMKRKGQASRKAKTQNNNTTLKKLRDLDMLIKTCRRAGKQQQEAQALYCKGVLLDNLQKWRKAIEAYEAFLELCHALDDVEGATVAYNCCAVDFFNLAMGNGAANRVIGLAEDGSSVPFFDEEDKHISEMREREQARREHDQATEARMSTLLNTAIAYNMKHFEASDEAGQFVAMSNTALCYSRLGDHQKALEYHQQALKLAIDLHSPHGQSLAVGNLALASGELGDWETARACMDKHLHLVRDLNNPEAESLACQQLGQMANKHGNYEDASYYFEEARRIAAAGGERGMLKMIRCSLGVVHGNMRMEEYMRELSAKFHASAL